MIRRIIKGIVKAALEVIRTEYAWFKIRMGKRKAGWAR